MQNVAITGTDNSPQYNNHANSWLYTYYHVDQLYGPSSYYIYSGMDLPSSKQEIFYTNNDSIIQTESYSYNTSRNQLTKVEQAGSLGETLEQEFIYPNDSHMLTTKWNMYSAKLEEVSRNNGLEVKRIRYNYPSSSSMLPLPSSVDYSETGVSGYTREFDYLYDQTNGNLIQYVGRDNVPISFLWGYGGHYPIIQAAGATYEELTTPLLDMGNVQWSRSYDQLSSLFTLLQNRLPHAHVSGYTYKPLVGIASNTGPDGVTTHYQYSRFNRLHKVLDSQGQLIKQYEYSYAGAVEPSAVLEKYTVFVTCSPTEAGIAVGMGTYTSGAYATVSTTPNSRYDFDGWYENGIKLNSSYSYSFRVTKNHLLTARFTHKPYHMIWLNVSPYNSGAVAGGGSFIRDTVVTVSAIPNSGYVFDGWYDGPNKLSSNTSYAHTVIKDCSLQARFIATTPYTITTIASPSGGGIITGGGNHIGGTNITLTAIANNGYTFAGWKENGVWITDASNKTLSFTVAGNRTLEAVFASGSPAINYINGEYRNGKLCVWAAYPVTSNVEVLFKGDSGAGATVILTVGQLEACSEEEDLHWEFRYPTTPSDEYYLYR